MTELIERPARVPARDPLRGEEWFAEQIGKSVQWCRKNRIELPHHMVGESPRYDDHCVDLYRAQTFRPAVDPFVRQSPAKGRGRARRE
ncbi:hypothetical protein ET495_03500 [Xylanimonas allomyrinae]|uniref:Uncharacterized protein n=1 Tax=Xylanimonas allomyrinae TaxID=2509459 RepID=A0A4P6EIY3_9MICO|nr:hypothetical protein [Xylanimonas allomyrinae]QAY62472.1 hypothetical protein ET495_03500 [Xylanimonas allomyrinae]